VSDLPEPEEEEGKIPIEERFDQLRKEGKSDKEIAIILAHEGYRYNKIVRLLHISVPMLKKMIEGEEPKTDNSPLNTEQVYKQPQMSQQGLSEHAQILKETLEMTAGVSREKIPNILKKFERRIDFYDSNPMYLYSLLQAAGINWIRSAQIVNDYLSEIGSEQIGPGLPLAAPGSEQVLRTLQQMYPWFQPPQQEQKEEGKGGEEDDFEKYLNRMVKILTLKMMASMGGEQADGKGISIEKIQETMLMKNLLKEPSQMPFGLGMGFGGVEYEPVLDEEGKPVRDEDGNVIMKMRYLPFSFPNMQKDEAKEDKGIVQAMVEVANKGNETALKVAEMVSRKQPEESSLTQVLLEQVNNLQNNLTNTLMERIKALEESDPLDYGIQLISKMKEAGLASREPNIEVTKLQTDLEKWKFDKQQEFNRWVWEQKQAMEDKKYARKSLEEFGKTLRDGIKEVAAPVAQGFKEGYVTAKRTGNAPEAQVQQQKPQQKQTNDLKQMSNDELLQIYEQAKNSERVVSDAKAKIIEEIHQRGLQI